MIAPRPIGHIAGALSFTALHICFRIAQATHDAIHVCWISDDGCIYLEPASTPTARAVVRHAPDQVQARYGKRPSLGWRDVEEDLQAARSAFVSRAMTEAMHA